MRFNISTVESLDTDCFIVQHSNCKRHQQTPIEELHLHISFSAGCSVAAFDFHHMARAQLTRLGSSVCGRLKQNYCGHDF